MFLYGDLSICFHNSYLFNKYLLLHLKELKGYNSVRCPPTPPLPATTTAALGVSIKGMQFSPNQEAPL